METRSFLCNIVVRLGYIFLDIIDTFEHLMLGKYTSAFQRDYDAKRMAAIENLYDADCKIFVSGEGKQISWASQVWMVLGGADEGGSLDDVAEFAGAEGMVTPYMYHRYADALLTAGRVDAALDVIHTYWGGMVKEGADTFWELYNPSNPNESPWWQYRQQLLPCMELCSSLFFEKK